MEEVNRKVKLFEASPGDKSMGRLLAFIAVIIGSMTLLVALVLFTYLIVYGELERLQQTPQCIAMAGLGIGLISSGEFLKGLQKKYEVSNG